MPSDLFIYSKRPLPCGRDVLEDAFDDAISGCGEVTGGGTGDAGWNLDVELFSDAVADAHVCAIVGTLRRLCVSSDTYLVVGADQSHVSVYPRDAQCDGCTTWVVRQAVGTPSLFVNAGWLGTISGRSGITRFVQCGVAKKTALLVTEMKNQPFRFLDSAAAIDALSDRLSDLGLTFAARDDNNLRLFRHHDPDSSYFLIWDYNWWPDGVHQEDSTVSLA